MKKPTHSMVHIDPLIMELWQSNRSLIEKNQQIIKQIRQDIWDLRKTMAKLAERMGLN